jgi:hypothetical protein
MRLLLLLVLAACEAQQLERGALGIGENTIDPPVLTFHADWTASLSGTLVAGQSARIEYDVARLPTCRATYNGLPAWGIVAQYNADGGWGHEANVTSGSASFIVPAGRDLAIWFFNSDEHDCTAWDSDYGRNFHFPIAAPAIIHFHQLDYAIAVDGTLRAGNDLMIDYELARAASCRATYNGLQSWDVIAHWRFDGGAVAGGSLSAPYNLAERESIPLEIAVQTGARDFEVWFENTDYTGCDAWDSDFGRNFHFALQ